ncbi:MAG: peptidoglycan DD-metalloendopeptidase family protein [Desulfohalobiaceae bacterium]
MIFLRQQFDPEQKKGQICLGRLLQGLFLALSMLLSPCICLASQAPDDLQDQVQERRQDLKQEKQDLQRLSDKERETYQDLARVEERIQELDSRLREQEQNLENTKQREQDLKQEHERLEQSVRKARQSLMQLLQAYWPAYVYSQSFAPAELGSFHEASRDMTWMEEIYDLLQDRAKELAREQQELRQSLAEQKELRQERSAQVEKIRSTQKELLQERMDFLRQVQKIRARKLAKEEQLQEIQKTVSKLEQRVKLLESRDIQELKGHLPWPAQGEQVQGFEAKGDSPSSGIGLALQEDQEVRAVCWGKVVFSDTLRGYGRVVIIFHGQEYYTLYAFLSRSLVQVGQDVEKGEPVGRAGYYPRIEGPGLYFELRAGQEPVNPEPWLSRAKPS